MVQRYIFSYFKGNGEDGLHLAYSEDGLAWRALNDDKPFFHPTVGKEKLTRDPSIVRGPDGMYHMVWTAGWNEQGFGYAESRDLITWTHERYVPVMSNEPTAMNTWAPEIFYDSLKDALSDLLGVDDPRPLPRRQHAAAAASTTIASTTRRRRTSAPSRRRSSSTTAASA